ncbi:response regulator transcription factor [Roseomonas frigidaquae]|uniref:Response regulator transcription factor n=1 Tax=Falsiroseomonas frigidaquae TaxID=487318 RepID=A0ABX1F1X3_9PROT|nr:response regulator transcription factor [Falsiroseomonas frigidaquae]NKE46323.1 response regulator transcription factor [Falsiroseomonas frigidaquae]
MRILLVEDDEVLSDGIRAGLSLHGIAAETVGTCEDARAALRANSFSAVVLDLMLPDGSGLSVLKELRGRGDRTPVLLLTARDAVGDRIAGLDTGADDYLGKPFDLEEVAARLRAIIRRAQGRSAPLLAWRGLRLDPARRSLENEGRAIALSRREFAILEALMERPGTILSKDRLQDRLYGWQEEVESNAVEVHVHNLRAKIGRDAIETVRGAGYRLGGEGP